MVESKNGFGIKVDVVSSDFSTISLNKDGQKIYIWHQSGKEDQLVFHKVNSGKPKDELEPAKLKDIAEFFRKNVNLSDNDSTNDYNKYLNAKALNSKIQKHNAKADSWFYKILRFFFRFKIEKIQEIDLEPFEKSSKHCNNMAVLGLQQITQELELITQKNDGKNL